MANRFLASIRLVLEACARGNDRAALIGGFALPFHGIQRATGDVDFLVDVTAGDAIDAALLGAGFRRVHRSDDAANYAGAPASFSGVDVIFARRPPTRAMLERARRHPTATAGVDVPVIDVEGLIGLKLQALVNDPRRRHRDQADIEALVALHLPALDLACSGEYFALFEMSDVLDAILDAARRHGTR